jgi:hypothetical protein
MKTIYNLLIAPVFLIVTILSTNACKKYKIIDDSNTGNLILKFDNIANGQPLTLGTNYINANGDTMNFSIFDYYLSNFSLVKTDGSIYTLPKDMCYFLLTEKGGANQGIELKNIPIGEYKEFRFMVGIDSLKSVSPINERTGILDPAGEGAAMYWAWNSGYIFVKVEGVSPQAPMDSASNSNKFRYHIGLFGGFSKPTLNNIKNISIADPTGDVAVIKAKGTPTIHVQVEIMEMFKNPTTVSVAANPTVMANAFSGTIANNYINMFKLNHIHN